MELGDVPGWLPEALTLALSGGALWVSFKARGDGRKSAQASVRSAVAAEGALALQRREAEARRAAEEEAARPRVDLRVEWVRRGKFRMVNYGGKTAANITCLNASALPRGLETPFTLERHAAHEFIMSGTHQERMPTELRVVWDGQEEPVNLSMPAV